MVNLNVVDLQNFCTTNKEAQDICNSDWFWKEKYQNDFGEVNLTWKTLYQATLAASGSVYILLDKINPIPKSAFLVTSYQNLLTNLTKLYNDAPFSLFHILMNLQNIYIPYPDIYENIAKQHHLNLNNNNDRLYVNYLVQQQIRKLPPLTVNRLDNILNQHFDVYKEQLINFKQPMFF